MPATSEEVRAVVVELLNGMVEQWGEELDEPITGESTLVEEVGLSSVDFVQFAVGVEERFKTKLGFQSLLIRGGNYVQDLTVDEVVTFVTERLNDPQPAEPAADSPPVPTAQRVTSLPPEEMVDEEKLAAFVQLIRPRQPRPDSVGGKNPAPVFVLSPPRSGSTLMRVMLAGNPQLFAPPELHLLAYADMAERASALQGQESSQLLEGAVRALMQLRDISGDEARSLIADCEAKQMATKEFYALLQEPLDGRLLVDKTPTYPLDAEILARAESDFESPKYIHLVRHPLGTIRSYEQSKLTRLMPLLDKSAFNGHQLAEMTWLHCHQNTMRFLAGVPRERQTKVLYEDVLQDPAGEMRRLSDFLGVPFHEDMTTPYADKEQRMTDGVDTASKMSGDIKFHLHQGIDPAAADRWKDYYSVDVLGAPTRALARQLGYEV